MSDSRASVVGGVVPPLITPLDEYGRLDRDGLKRLADRVIDGGVHGVFVGGTSGEYSALPLDTRLEAIHCLCEAVGGRVPVYAGIGAQAFEDLQLMMDGVEGSDVDFVVLQPPAYFPMHDEDVLAYFEGVLQRSTLPLVLYNIPSCTINEISVPTLGRLARHPRVASLKDSSGSMEYLREAIDRLEGIRPGFPVLIGDEARIVDACRLGAAGCVPSLANLHPRLLVRCWNAAIAGDWEAAEQAQQEVIHATDAVRGAGMKWIDSVRFLKNELAREGVCRPHMSKLFSQSRGNCGKEVLSHA